MKKWVAYGLVLSVALAFLVAQRPDKKSPSAGKRQPQVAGRHVFGLSDFPDIDVTQWGEEVSLNEASQKLRIRLADEYLSGKPKIKIGGAGEETTTASIFYSNQVHQTISRFPWEGRVEPADWYSKRAEANNREIRESQEWPGHGDPGARWVETTVAGNPGFFLEQGYNDVDGIKSSRPSWVTWYQVEDKLEYNLSADNMPVAKLLALAESVARDESREVIPGDIRPFVIAIRALRAEYRLPAQVEATVRIQPDTDSQKEQLIANRNIILEMANLDDLSIDADSQRPPKSASVVVEGCRIFLQLDKALNVPEEQRRLQQDLDRVNTYLAELDKDLKQPASAGVPEMQLLLGRLQNWRDYLEQKAESLK